MTDEEIVKDLTELSLYTGFQEKHIQVLNAALDLINRQKAEIETLKEFIVEISRCDKEIKSESVKEFAERLKSLVNQRHYMLANIHNSRDFGMFTVGFEQAIDNIVKEMVGDKE